jgi:hypothetical protein
LAGYFYKQKDKKMITDNDFLLLVDSTYNEVHESDNEDWEQEFFDKLRDKIHDISPYLRVDSFIYDEDCDSVSDILCFLERRISMKDGGELISMVDLVTDTGYVIVLLKRL